MELGDYLIKVMAGIEKGLEKMAPPRKLILFLGAEGRVVGSSLEYGGNQPEN